MTKIHPDAAKDMFPPPRGFNPVHDGPKAIEPRPSVTEAEAPCIGCGRDIADKPYVIDDNGEIGCPACFDDARQDECWAHDRDVERVARAICEAAILVAYPDASPTVLATLVEHFSPKCMPEARAAIAALTASKPEAESVNPPEGGKAGDHCSLPPEGWYCTRIPGHEGPCAARPKRGKPEEWLADVPADIETVWRDYTSAPLSFDGGIISVNRDGSGHFAADEMHVDWETDDENGKTYVVADFARGEAQAIRDHLNKYFPTAALRTSSNAELIEARDFYAARYAERCGALAKAQSVNAELIEALRKYAVQMEYDYPSETPVECGLWCDLCKAHVEADGSGHKSTCLLSRRPSEPSEREKIVAFVREEAKKSPPLVRAHHYAVADAIERGDFLSTEEDK